MVRSRLAFALFLGLWTGPLPGQEGPPPWEVSTPGGHFLKSTDLELSRLLPPPPPRDSLAEAADLEAVLQAQVGRTPAQEAWAKETAHDTVWGFASELGPWFHAERLPKMARFFWQLTVDAYAISEEAKRLFDRPRPPKRDPRIRPVVFMPPNDSYPSGHSVQAFVRGAVLAEIFPERREALLARAHRSAWGRILGGVHYPTDDVGGRLLAEAMLTRLKTLPTFQQAVKACREEARAFLPES
jgi:acid phosphatase (class A)